MQFVQKNKYYRIITIQVIYRSTLIYIIGYGYRENYLFYKGTRACNIISSELPGKFSNLKNKEVFRYEKHNNKIICSGETPQSWQDKNSGVVRNLHEQRTLYQQQELRLWQEFWQMNLHVRWAGNRGFWKLCSRGFYECIQKFPVDGRHDRQ